MKIGFVIPAWPGDRHANGITTTVCYLAEGTETLGHEVTIIPLNDGVSDDDRVVALPPARDMTVFERITSRLKLADPVHEVMGERIAAAAQTAIHSRGIDVLVMEETQGWAKTVQDRLPIPVIVTLHGPWFIQTRVQKEKVLASDKRRERREAQAFRECAGIASPSRNVLDITRATVKDLASAQAVIYNPILPKAPVCYEQLDEKQRKSILFVGRHDLRKGADTLLQGFAELVGQGADVYLTFIGPDPGVTQANGSQVFINEALSRLGQEVERRVTYLGHCSKAEIDVQRQQHLLTLITSRYETFGYTVLEALSAGSATISTDAGGPAEIIRDGETGLLVPPGDPTALANACMRILNDPDLAASFGQAARHDVNARFAPEKIAAQLVKFSEQVIAQSKR